MDNVLQFPDQAGLMRVSTAIDAYLRAGNPSELRRALREHPDLMTDTADGLLEAFAQDQAGGARQMVEARLGFLRRCRTMGVAQAFAEQEGPGVPAEVGLLLQELATPAPPAAMPQRIRRCEQALRSVPRERDPRLWATLQFYLGDCWCQNQREDRAANVERAIAAYQRSLEVRTRQELPHEWADSMKRLGMSYVTRLRDKRIDNVERAIDFHQQALKVNTREARPEEWAHGKASLALAYAERIRGGPADNQESSIRAYEEALEVIRRETAPELWATTVHNLATVYCRRIRGTRADNIEQAIDLMKQASQVFRRETKPHEWAAIRISLANAYFDRVHGDRAENLERTIEALEQALEVRTRQAAPQNWAVATTNLGNAYAARIRGQLWENQERAIQLYQQALTVATHEAMPDQWAAVMLNLAHTYAKRINGDLDDNLDRSIAAYDKALSVFTREAWAIRWAMIMNNLAEAYHRRIKPAGRTENLERALKVCRRALEVRTRETMPLEWARTQHNLAAIYHERQQGHRSDNLERGIEACRQALEIRTLDAVPAIHRLSADLLGKLCAEAGRWQEAAEALESALAATEHLYQASLFRTSQHAELAESGFLYRRAAEALARCGRLREAVVVAERGRTRCLGDAVDRHRIDLERVEAADPWAGDLYQKAVDRLRWLESMNRAEDADSPADRAAITGEDLRRKVLATREDLNRAIARIRRIPGFQNVLHEPGFDEIAAEVRPGQPLVYLLPFVDKTLALLMHCQPSPEAAAPGVAVEHLWLAGLAAKEDQRGAFPLAPPDGNRETVEEIMKMTASAVGAGILGPVAARLRELGATAVVLIPGSVLGAVYPLHAIPYPVDGRSICLLDELDVSYAPSVRVLATARRSLAEHGSRQPVLAGVGNPATKAAEPLRYARAELEDVADLFGEANSKVFYEQEATREALLRCLPAADYLHLACHGTYDPRVLMAAQLLLAGDQTLSLEELERLRPLAHNRLVVLSACTTATSQPFQLADEMIGLPAGFLEAGAPAVVGTFWPVDDLSTALVMLKFYTYHLKGDASRGEGPMAPPAALRRAQLWLRDATAGELMRFFEQQRALREQERVSAERGLSEEAAAAAVDRFILEDSAVRPFADPYYWAPFLFMGA